MKYLKFLFVLLFSSVVLSQTVGDGNSFKAGTWEMNFTGNLGSINSSVKVSSSSYSNESTESNNFFELGVVPGYYVSDNFSFEPEIKFLFLENMKPAFSLIVNFSYTMGNLSGVFVPYFRAGYGASNGMPVPTLNDAILRTSDSMDIYIINSDLGIKILVSESAIIRTGLNYRRYSYKKNKTVYTRSYTNEYKISNISLLFGISLLLGG